MTQELRKKLDKTKAHRWLSSFHGDDLIDEAMKELESLIQGEVRSALERVKFRATESDEMIDFEDAVDEELSNHPKGKE